MLFWNGSFLAFVHKISKNNLSKMLIFAHMLKKEFKNA